MLSLEGTDRVGGILQLGLEARSIFGFGAQSRHPKLMMFIELRNKPAGITKFGYRQNKCR